MEVWLFELLKGFGKLFLHPFFYGALIAALLLGLKRVKRERRDFHIRVHDTVTELIQLVLPGIVIGLICSVLTLGIGLTISKGFLTVVGALSLLFALTTQVRWLSPAYTVSFALLVVFLVPQLNESWAEALQISNASYIYLAVLLVLLVGAEAFLIRRSGARNTSPLLAKGKRGKLIGAHEAKKLWMLPLFLLIPVDNGITQLPWWPVFAAGNGETYTFMLVPFAVGFHQRVSSELPSVVVNRMGRQVMGLAMLLALIAVASYWVSYAAVATAAVAVIGREWITYRQKRKDDEQPNLFTSRKDGLIITGIIPKSPAEKLGVQIGERIQKVNGQAVNTEKGFYEALQLNLAFCKMEVVDLNGEMRFAQSAVFEGEHHELGLLFIPDEKVKVTRTG
ncbi:PDZ domain-containing protein [Bacillus tianshenii]|nr:PDZ domain-containing protein [Bacillus tianshenii]